MIFIKSIKIANRKRYRVDNYFSDKNGKGYVGTTYSTNTKKAVNAAMNNQLALVKQGYNPLGFHYMKESKKFKIKGKGSKNEDYSKERAWIKKKLLNENITQDQLLFSVGCFSNKKKEKVMAEKNINSSEYNKRSKFLCNVFILLSNEKF